MAAAGAGVVVVMVRDPVELLPTVVVVLLGRGAAVLREDRPDLAVRQA
jgi:hypothetical protein